MKCYAQIHDYTLLIANAENYGHICNQSHVSRAAFLAFSTDY